MGQLTTLLAATLVLVPASAWAVGPDWSYLDAGLIRDGELEQPSGRDISGKGLDFEGSVGLGDFLFFQAALEAGRLEVGPGTDQAHDRFSIGPGLSANIEMGGTVIAPWVRAGYRRDNLGSAVFDGYSGAAGVRWLLSPRVEAEFSGGYGETEGGIGAGDAEIEDTTYELALRYAVTARWMLTAAYRTSELESDANVFGASGASVDQDRLLFGARWHYAADPGALVDDDDEIAADHDNYLDTLYLAGGGLEIAGGSELDVEHGTLVRGSAAVTEHVIVRGSALNADIDVGGGDEAAADWYALGPGLSFTDSVGAGEMDLYGSVSYDRVDFARGGRVFDGAGAMLGMRYRIAGFEIAPSAKLFATESAAGFDLDGERYGLDVLYAVSPAVSLVGHATHINGESDAPGAVADIQQTVYGAGFRFYYGAGS